MKKIIKNYSELIVLPTLVQRFDYLKLSGVVAKETFGWDRVFNQRFYKSAEWRRIRRTVILRDKGLELGVVGYDIGGQILVHHMNPIQLEDISKRIDSILDPEFLISVSFLTHQAIHYGDRSLLPKDLVRRYSGDTTLWKRKG